MVKTSYRIIYTFLDHSAGLFEDGAVELLSNTKVFESWKDVFKYIKRWEVRRAFNELVNQGFDPLSLDLVYSEHANQAYIDVYNDDEFIGRYVYGFIAI